MSNLLVSTRVNAKRFFDWGIWFFESFDSGAFQEFPKLSTFFIKFCFATLIPLTVAKAAQGIYPDRLK